MPGERRVTILFVNWRLNLCKKSERVKARRRKVENDATWAFGPHDGGHADLGGAGLFGLAYTVFGPQGFDLSLNGLVDEDARAKWAAAVGVVPADLEAAGYPVCDPDLEGVYIDTLGVTVVIPMLVASPSIGQAMLLQSCAVATVAAITIPPPTASPGPVQSAMIATHDVATAALTPISASRPPAQRTTAYSDSSSADIEYSPGGWS